MLHTFRTILVTLFGIIINSIGICTEPVKNATFSLTDEVIVKPKDIFIRKMVISPDGKMAYVVGEEYVEPTEEPNPNVPVPDVLVPKGYIVDFTKKSTKEFLNGHKRPITDMSRTPDGRYIYTISSTTESNVRIWDVVNEKSTLHAEFVPDELYESNHLEMALLPKRGGVAAPLKGKVALTAKLKADRFDLGGEPFKDTILCNPTVDHKEGFLACNTFEGDILIWDIEKLDFTARIKPFPNQILDSPDNYSIVDMKFSNTSKTLYYARIGKDDEVPEDERTKEDKVAADKRGIWVVDIEAETIKPLGFGTTCRTEHFALDPTDRWMAVLGTSYPDDDKKVNGQLLKVTELRIYDMKSKTLVHRKQFKEFRPGHILFSDDGKKLVCADPFGEVRSWSISLTGK